MNIEFEKALQYIDLGNYEKAIRALETAIMQEEDAENMDEATKYRCVLGELYVNLGMEAQARDELSTVVEYCDKTSTLNEQRTIAKAYINAYDGIPLPKEMRRGDESEKKITRPGDMPLVPKPMQNKAFINKQMSKKHR